MLKIKFVNFNSIYESVKGAIISRTIANNKMYTLLHYQLYQKNRIIYKTQFKTSNRLKVKIDGKLYYIIQNYDIKSPSKEPYKAFSTENNNYHNLGLNQLFVGQNPYKPYNGDPKKGIYHDESQIWTKSYNLTPFGEYIGLSEDKKKKVVALSREVWGWVGQSASGQIELFYDAFNALYLGEIKTLVYPKLNLLGQLEILNIIYLKDEQVFEQKEYKNETYSVSYKKCLYRIIYANGTTKDISLIPKALSFSKEGNTLVAYQGIVFFRYQNLTRLELMPYALDMDFCIKRYGQLVYKDIVGISSPLLPKNPFTQDKGALNKDIQIVTFTNDDLDVKEGYMIGFSSGVYFSFFAGGVRWVKKKKKDSEYTVKTIREPRISFEILIDEKGYLKLKKEEFAKNWDRYFELYVHEDNSEMKFWIGIGTIVLMAITGYFAGVGVIAAQGAMASGVAATYTIGGVTVTALDIAIVGAMSSFIGVMGMLTQNKILSAIGIVGGLISGFISGLAQNMAKTAATETAKQGAKEGIKQTSKSLIQKSLELLTFKNILSYVSSSWLDTLSSVFSLVSLVPKKPKEEENEVKEEEEEEEIKAKGVREDEIIGSSFIQKVEIIPFLDGKVMPLDAFLEEADTSFKKISY